MVAAADHRLSHHTNARHPSLGLQCIPERHFWRDFRVTNERPEPGYSVSSFAIVPETCDAEGQPHLGAVALVIDGGGASTAIGLVTPDWLATSDLSHSAGAPFREGPIVIVARAIRVGSNVAVVRAEVGDGHGSDDPTAMRRTGLSIMKFARIPGSASVITGQISTTSPKSTNALTGSGFRQPMFDQTGMRVVDHGIVELDRSDYVRNSFGSINGGALVVLAGRAALSLTDEGWVATDVQTHYLAQTKAGPARATATWLREGADAVVEVHVRDTSNNDTLLTHNLVKLRPAHPPRRIGLRGRVGEEIAEF